MRAIDFEAKGNVVRVFLSNREDLSNVHGDDWDDRGQTDRVYCEYVDGYKDFIFDFHKDVYTCNSLIDDYKACKDDMKAGMFPMVVVVNANEYSSWAGFTDLMAARDAFKIYFGDEFEPDQVAPEFDEEHHWDKYDWMVS